MRGYKRKEKQMKLGMYSYNPWGLGFYSVERNHNNHDKKTKLRKVLAELYIQIKF